jgi:hypothetical protein
MGGGAPIRIPVTIANGAALSGAVDTRGATIEAIEMPAAWTAADLTFQAADSETGTFSDVYDALGGEITVVVAASRTVTIQDPFDYNMRGLRYVKVRSGTSGTPVNQAGARTLYLICKYR